MKIGKVSSKELIKSILPYKGYTNNNVVIWPGIGIDSGVIKLGENYIVASIDPITATPHLIGKWVAYVATNDVLASGALPKWFLLTLLLPENTHTGTIELIMEELSSTLKKLEVSLIGGHTERTPGITQPIAIGTVIGITNIILSPKNISENDALYMLGKGGIEGGYIIYKLKEREIKDILTPEELKEINSFPDKISIYPYVKTILDNNLITAIKWMHDPTEGGIFNGIYEISLASNRYINIKLTNDLIHPITLKLCRMYNLNPYKILSSGSLLIVVNKEKEKEFIEKSRKANLFPVKLGTISKEGEGVNIVNKSEIHYDFKEPNIDEIWKIIE